MSFCIRNTTYQSPITKNSSFEEKSSDVTVKETFEEKISNSVNESVLKFDMSINSWVWREMNDTGISCSRGPTGSLVNIENIEEISNTTNDNSTVEIEDKTKKVEMTKNNQACKKRQQKKKR